MKFSFVCVHCKKYIKSEVIFFGAGLVGTVPCCKNCIKYEVEENEGR